MTDIQQCSIRELSLDEVDSIGGGKGFWGRVGHGIQSFEKDVDAGAFVGGVTGGTGGAIAGGPAGILPGAAAGIVVGAAGGAATWLAGEIGL